MVTASPSFWGSLPEKKVLAFNYKFTRSVTEKEQVMLKRVNTTQHTRLYNRYPTELRNKLWD